jgi:hypothetical protein
MSVDSIFWYWSLLRASCSAAAEIWFCVLAAGLPLFPIVFATVTPVVITVPSIAAMAAAVAAILQFLYKLVFSEFVTMLREDRFFVIHRPVAMRDVFHMVHLQQWLCCI